MTLLADVNRPGSQEDVVSNMVWLYEGKIVVWDFTEGLIIETSLRAIPLYVSYSSKGDYYYFSFFVIKYT